MKVLAIPILGLLVGVYGASAGELAFTEVAESIGLRFEHQPLGDTPGWHQHGGGTVGDFNNDGWPDLLLLGGGSSPDGLFINDGTGRFEDRAAAAGLVDLYRSVAANAADFDDDGWTDIYVTSLGTRPEIRNGQHRLYRNNRDGTFTDVAVAAGVSATAPDAFADGYGATWGDHDLDGDLDLWVAGWGNTLLPAYPSTRLFRNEGDGTFNDVTVAAGLEDKNLRALGGVFIDMDGDRYPELLVAGDFGTSRYYANRRDGTFANLDPGLPRREKAHNGMGSAVGDLDRDGRPDWFVTAIFPAFGNEGPPGNRLYLNRSATKGDHRLRALPYAGGVHDGGWGWGAAAVDLDHDGWIDLVHTNGWDQECAAGGFCYQADATRLFRNHGDGSFSDEAAAAGLEHTGQGRALFHLDHDRDGDMDVAIYDNVGRIHLFRNDLSGPDTHWLKVKLDTRAAPDLAPHGIGARVEIRTANGERQSRWIEVGTTYLGRGEIVAHFGLGRTAVVNAVVVTWPDGSRTVRRDVAADQELWIAAAEARVLTAE